MCAVDVFGCGVCGGNGDVVVVNECSTLCMLSFPLPLSDRFYVKQWRGEINK